MSGSGRLAGCGTIDAPLNVLPDPIHDRLAAGGDVAFLGPALAVRLRRIRVEDAHGRPIALRHPVVETLRAKGKVYRSGRPAYRAQHAAAKSGASRRWRTLADDGF